MTILSRILHSKIVAIIRGANPDDVLRIVEALYAGGIELIEVTLNSSRALFVIEQLANQVSDRILIGAGTVLDAQTAGSAIAAGAKFIISPSLDMETIRMTKLHQVISIPGAFTPTEIVTAYSNGADIVKVFPARLGPEYIRDILAPLPHIPLMPTGSVNLANIGEFLKAGAVAFGIGSALVNTNEKVNDEYLAQLTVTAAKYVKAIAVPAN